MSTSLCSNIKLRLTKFCVGSDYKWAKQFDKTSRSYGDFGRCTGTDRHVKRACCLHHQDDMFLKIPETDVRRTVLHLSVRTPMAHVNRKRTLQKAVYCLQYSMGACYWLIQRCFSNYTGYTPA
ncbi:hypothetical protein L798_05770 [Zootermopsis nevadensis]|uniref:Uncharacterized protein n=1 Tax=Zootermopsis nevadensis TaxID=136037 RepID=A0A067R8F6_ZOONE|nr:hypothetical protein L798_05770 [Zootermopsis nevadensis]